MLMPLVLLSGCMHHQPRMNRKSYHLNAQTADDSRLIDDIRVSSKKVHYDKKTDCTIVKLTVENRSDASCSFSRSDLNVPLISQEQAYKLVKSTRFIKPLVAGGIGCGVGAAGVLGSISLISSMTAKSTTAYAYAYLLGPLMLVPIVVIPLVAGAAVGGIIYALIPDERNKLGIEYMCGAGKKKVIFSGETQTVLLLVKGQQIQDLSVALQTDNGRVDYALRLF